jgi:hypothetical protein
MPPEFDLQVECEKLVCFDMSRVRLGNLQAEMEPIGIKNMAK